MVLKLGTFPEVDQKYLECAGEEGRSVGPSVWEMWKYYTDSSRAGISYLQ
jgi:hypothetical protein